MPSTYSNLKIQLMATGENNTTWGDVTNVNLGTALEEAIVGSADVAFSNANVTLTLTDTNSTQSARNMRLNLTGTATTGYNLVVPAIEKPYIVNNGTDGTITVKNTTGTGIAVPAGKTMWLFNNGTNVVDVVTHLSSVTLGSALPVASGGTGVTTSTGTTSVVLSNSPVLVTPTLGAASATSIANGLGAVGTPSYTFTGDTNTGMWSPAADTIAFSEGGVEAMRIDSSGNVGIGTTSLSARFTVNGGSGTSQTRFEVSTTEVQEVATNAAQSAYANRLADAAQHIWKITGSERMRIDSSGNVGIGTSSPVSKLDVNGNINVSGTGQFTNATYCQIGATSGTVQGQFAANSSGGTVDLRAVSSHPLTFLTNNTERMRIDSSGNVGIGTSAPGASTRLNVNGRGLFTGGSYDPSDSTASGVSISYDTGSNIGIIGAIQTGVTEREMRMRGNTLTFFTNGANERMRIDSSGNVGIGTSSPGDRLVVSSSVNGNSGAYIQNASTGASAQTVVTVAASGKNGLQLVQSYTSGNIGIYTGDNVPISFSTNAAERMRIDASGNVGIGTSSPSFQLDVAGNSPSTATFVRSRNNDATSASFAGYGCSTGEGVNAEWYSYSGANTFGTKTNHPQLFITNNAERMRIDTSGNVGIGTSSPVAKLDVNGNINASGIGQFTNATYCYVGATSGAVQGQFAANGGGEVNVRAVSNHPLTFLTNNTERMRIDSSGNVGIGTSAPSYRLQVNASSGANQVAYFINDSAGSTLAGISASINGGGNNTNSYHFVGVTQTVALWYLYGNGTTSYTSDIRVKKNVTTTRDGYLDDVCKLRVVKYNWYNDSDDTPRELGLIAQEVEQVFPGLVQDALHPTKDGEIHKVLKGSVMMPIMLKALQEASAKIDALTARVAQLEGN